MNYPLSYPYIKVYSDDKNRMRYVWHSSTTKRGMQQEDTVGNVLIEFLLLDLTDYEKRINDVFHNDDFTIDSMDELTFIMLNAEIYEIAKILLPLHEIAHFYLFGKLNSVFASELSESKQIKIAVQVLEEVITLQQMFMDGLTMCCDIDFDSEGITQSGRFIAFMALHQEFMFCYLLTGTAIAPTKNGKADFGTLDKMEIADKKEQLAAIDKLNQKGANIVSFTILQSFDEFLYFEFTELLKQGIQVRKCRNCGRYFVLKSKHETFYCDRTIGNDRSCKEIGNKLEYQKKLSEDAALLRYERIYKRRYSKMLRDEAKEVPTVDKSVARQTFLAWSESAKAARRQYLAGNISAEDFERQLEKR